MTIGNFLHKRFEWTLETVCAGLAHIAPTKLVCSPGIHEMHDPTANIFCDFWNNFCLQFHSTGT
jgi:hypothetical protein